MIRKVSEHANKGLEGRMDRGKACAANALRFGDAIGLGNCQGDCSIDVNPPMALPDPPSTAHAPRVAILRHSAIDGPGWLTHYFKRCGWETQLIDAPDDDFDAIDPREIDLVVVLGSALSVDDRNLFPFIGREIDFLQRRIAADRPVLGICFGAQLLAAALGAAVYRAPRDEIGWYPLELTPAGIDSPLRELAPALTPAVMHWHQDTFDLPAGTQRLARSERCDVQAFSRGRKLLALQFHPEVTVRGVEGWLIDSSFPETTRAARIAEIRAGTLQHQATMQAQFSRCLDDWLALATG